LNHNRGKSADGEWTAVNKGDRLWVETLSPIHDTISIQVSDPEAKSDVEHVGQSPIVWGQPPFRHEFGGDEGFFWSPMGHKLAFYRIDQLEVSRYPLLLTDPRRAKVKWIRYPMAGCPSQKVTLGVYDPDTEQTIFLGTNQKPNASTDMNRSDHYITNICWTPDSRHILIAELNRAQTRMEMNMYDATDGKFVRTLFVEESPKYVEPDEPAYFLPGNSDKFLWLSERDGFRHLYLYDIAKDKTSCRQLTSGPFVITELVGVDPESKYAYVITTEDSPLERNLYCINLATGKRNRLTSEPAIHHIQHNKQYTQFYDVYSNHEVARICQLLTVKNGKVVDVKKRFTPGDPFQTAGLAHPEVEVGTIKAADGVTDLYYRLVKPKDLSVKHPTIVYLYNGPHTQLITDDYLWGLPGWDNYMAQHGYVVFTLDGRGSENRGRDFEQVTWHNIGHNESLDQLLGVEFLKTLPYVDPERLGIYGWSYGGFMATYMMLYYPEVFKVGVAGGPVLDWSRYEVMYGERYMGMPGENKEGYEATTLINKTGTLKGRLLIIHDDHDATCVPQMSMQFLKNAVNADTYPDFMMYMNHEHNVMGNDRVHLLNNITRYFEDHL